MTARLIRVEADGMVDCRKALKAKFAFDAMIQDLRASFLYVELVREVRGAALRKLCNAEE
jgi:hypothetical protein